MVYTHSSVCVRRSAVAREFTWCIHTHQCVFVEVQQLECAHGVHILDGWFARAFIQKKNEYKEIKCSLLSEECEGR